MTEAQLELRRRIFAAFAANGVAPDVSGEDPALLEALERVHVLVRDEAGAIATDDSVFHVAVPAARWWDDIAFT